MQRRNTDPGQGYESEYDGYGNPTEEHRRNEKQEKKENIGKPEQKQQESEKDRNEDGGTQKFKSRSGRSGFGGRRR